jgi:hypothetical protein
VKCGVLDRQKTTYRDLTPRENEDEIDKWGNHYLLLLRESYGLDENVTEFQERTCVNCGYQWAENVYRAQ